jgi:hypothetical protein
VPAFGTAGHRRALRDGDRIRLETAQGTWREQPEQSRVSKRIERGARQPTLAFSDISVCGDGRADAARRSQNRVVYRGTDVWRNVGRRDAWMKWIAHQTLSQRVQLAGRYIASSARNTNPAQKRASNGL